MANRGQAAAGRQADPMNRLADLLEGALQVQAPRDRFKSPQYDGKSDVELFIRTFTDVATANHWDQNAQLINLRLSLEREATDCSRGNDVQTIFDNLRARFGLTVRQARDRLANLKKDPGQSYHTLGVEIQHLVRLAYPTMGENDRMIISVENLKRCIDNRALSRHLLAVERDTVTAVAQAADEFVQAGALLNTRPHINQIDNVDDASVIEDDVPIN